MAYGCACNGLAAFSAVAQRQEHIAMDTTDLALVIVRLVVGLTFAAHGAQKAFGWWNGPGMPGWQGVMERLGFRPTWVFAAVSMMAELGGGLLLALGLLTPLAVAALIGQSVVIILKSHLPRGFWNRDNGFEFPLSLTAGILAIGLVGPGSVSLDAALGSVPADAVRLGAIALGLLGGALTLVVPMLHRPAAEHAAQT
jgi:putative oxidoreductase